MSELQGHVETCMGRVNFEIGLKDILSNLLMKIIIQNIIDQPSKLFKFS